MNERMSQVIIHKDLVYTSGQVAITAKGETASIQTKAILKKIDELLKESGTDKSKVISAMIWMSNTSDFDEINKVWDSWVTPNHAPCRACVQAILAKPEFNVEISVIAAC